MLLRRCYSLLAIILSAVMATTLVQPLLRTQDRICANVPLQRYLSHHSSNSVDEVPVASFLRATLQDFL